MVYLESVFEQDRGWLHPHFLDQRIQQYYE